MKLYVLPTEKSCNASCKFCITDYRKTAKNEFLDLSCLEKALEYFDPEKIEITGGGEPLLHPKINELVYSCSRKNRENRPTKLYTNGALFNKVGSNDGKGNGKLGWLESTCISRAHYDEKENERVMGISYGIKEIFDSGWNIGLSLLVHKSGINNYSDLKKYFSWARGLDAKKVVVRQLFEHDYGGKLEEELVSTEKLAQNFDHYEKKGSLHSFFLDMPIEFELRTCSYEFDNPVLHADGKAYRGWSQEVLYDFNRT